MEFTKRFHSARNIDIDIGYRTYFADIDTYTWIERIGVNMHDNEIIFAQFEWWITYQRLNINA